MGGSAGIPPIRWSWPDISFEFFAVNLGFDLKLLVRPYALTGDSVALLSLLTLPDSGDLLSASGTRSLR